jgi:AhpD family alkylhydroperoxidase
MFVRRLGTITLICASLIALAATPLAAAETMSPELKAVYAEIEQAFGFVPSFVRSFPAEALPGAWEEMRDLEMNPNTAIPGKYKSLIGVAVSAQIPCAYCVYFDTQSAKGEGATDREIQEAIAMSALTRHWSTVLNGLNLDMADFKKDIDGILAYTAEASKRPAPMSEMPVTDAASAYRDMERSLGRVPGFMKAFPQASIAGAWKEFKGLQMNPNTAVPGKYKELAGLAVAAQIPCSYCVEAHTAFAKANGATDQEIAEAVGMAALTRHWSTVLNGSQMDFAAFKTEADRMMHHASQSASTTK